MEGLAGIGKLYAIATYAATIRLTLKLRPGPPVASLPLPNLKTAPKLAAARTTVFEGEIVSRDYEPVPGQWYENLEEEEPFRVLTMDEDSELVEIEYLDGDIEEIDLETWHEMDLELTQEPEGWSESQDEDDDEDDEDDDWDDEDEDDDDLDDDEDEDEAEDREQY
jgi:hypothetical protein